MAYGDATSGLTEQEQAVLEEGDLTLEPLPGSDPLADTTIKYAAIITRSLSTREVSRRMGLTPSRVRQMIAERSLLSCLKARRCIASIDAVGHTQRCGT